MAEESRIIKILVQYNNGASERVFSLWHKDLLTIPRVGESLVITVRDGFSIEVHELEVVKVQHRWSTDRVINGFLSLEPNCIYCKYA